MRDREFSNNSFQILPRTPAETSPDCRQTCPWVSPTHSPMARAQDNQEACLPNTVEGFASC